MAISNKTLCSICTEFCGFDAYIDDSCPQGRQCLADRAAVLDGIASRLDAIRREHGPASIAVCCGTSATFAARAWLHGIGSDRLFSSLTVGQPALAAGPHDLASSDVAMLVCEHVGTAVMKEATKRGLKLIVVDPQRTEMARLADLHLQIRPGEEPTLLAGMVKLILDDGRCDEAFCAEFDMGIDELRRALEPFTLDYVARRTSVVAADIVHAVGMLTAAERGTVRNALGPDMRPQSGLAEHFASCINILCGRMNRADEVDEHIHLSTPDVLSLGQDRIRALVVVGGDPLASWLDREATSRTLRSLDLLVCIDVRRTDIVALADYVLPGSDGSEREQTGGAGPEWAHFAELARRLGTPMQPPGGALRLLRLYTDAVAEEIDTLRKRDLGADGDFTHLLICRHDGYGDDSPAYLHPLDVVMLGVWSGQAMRLVSAHGAIEVRVVEDPSVRPGVASVPRGLYRAARMPVGSVQQVRFESIP